MDFHYTPTPSLTYRVGGVLLRKELLWIHAHPQLLIRYTLLEASSPTTLRLRPFLAFRDKHTLGKANFYADGHSYPVPGGVRNRLYEGFPWLYLQVDSDAAEFVAAPDWYNNFEYDEERARGYDYLEDLLTTGYFEVADHPRTADRLLVFDRSRPFGRRTGRPVRGGAGPPQRQARLSSPACATRPASSSSAAATGPKSRPAIPGSDAGAATPSSPCRASRSPRAT